MATTNELHAEPTAQPAGVELRHIPLSRIVVPDGFNPRGGVGDDRELEQLAETIREHGLLQPLRLRSTDHGDLVLIAGERRYRAALKAGLNEAPAIIRPAGAGDDDEQADLLVEALIENDQRCNLDSVSRARAYQRLIDSGLTVKGVAQRVGTTQARVREHLRVLKLPGELQTKVACGEVPLRAVKPLCQLEAIHPGLAVQAANEVLDSQDSYEPYTWADVERSPLDVALASDALPEGVYRLHTPYTLDAFSLSEGAKTDLQALERMRGRPIESIRFEAADFDYACSLGAGHGEGWQAVVVGTDVASQLACDALARAVKTQRQRVREQERLARAQTDGETSGGTAERGDAANLERSTDDDRRAQREADRQAREKATRFNLELGRGIYTTLSRVRVDTTVLKLLASVDVVGHLADVAMRGARYGIPGWVTEGTQRNGKTKYGYLDRAEAEQRAEAFLAGASKPGEIAGRQLVLLAMAVLADQDAVAASNRSWHDVKVTGPWASEFDQLFHQFLTDTLPAGTLAVLQPLLDQRRKQQHERDAARKARQEAAARLEGVEERISELSIEEVDKAERDLDGAAVRWTPRGARLRGQLSDRRQQLAGADRGD